MRQVNWINLWIGWTEKKRKKKDGSRVGCNFPKNHIKIPCTNTQTFIVIILRFGFFMFFAHCACIKYHFWMFFFLLFSSILRSTLFFSLDKSVLSAVCSDKLLCDAFWNQNHFVFRFYFRTFVEFNGFVYVFMSTWYAENVFGYFFLFFFGALHIHFGSWSRNLSVPNESRKISSLKRGWSVHWYWYLVFGSDAEWEIMSVYHKNDIVSHFTHVPYIYFIRGLPSKERRRKMPKLQWKFGFCAAVITKHSRERESEKKTLDNSWVLKESKAKKNINKKTRKKNMRKMTINCCCLQFEQYFERIHNSQHHHFYAKSSLSSSHSFWIQIHGANISNAECNFKFNIYRKKIVWSETSLPHHFRTFHSLFLALSSRYWMQNSFIYFIPTLSPLHIHPMDNNNKFQKMLKCI